MWWEKPLDDVDRLLAEPDEDGDLGVEIFDGWIKEDKWAQIKADEEDKPITLPISNEPVIISEERKRELQNQLGEVLAKRKQRKQNPSCIIKRNNKEPRLCLIKFPDGKAKEETISLEQALQYKRQWCKVTLKEW